MKVILSRKGFDSAAGGEASPHFLDSGRLLSLPIPEDTKNNSILTGRTYADLRFDDRLSYLDIMKQLNLKGFEKTHVHLDPDINFPVLSNRPTDWQGLFGQSSSSQAHLRNKCVGKGDLFLFFGWFKDVRKTSKGYEYIAGTDRHIIWGYLQVEEVQSIIPGKEYEEWKQGHPHYFYRKREENTGYLASKTLSFAPDLPGYGVFNYKDSLDLTYPNHKNRSFWKLPKCFHPSFGTTMTYHENLKDKSGNPIWNLHDTHCTLKSVGRGQEFVIEGNDQIVQWAQKLFEDIGKLP